MKRHHPRLDEGRPPVGWQLTREIDKNRSVLPKRFAGSMAKHRPAFSVFADRRKYSGRPKPSLPKLKYLEASED
jgi:hypothetical protein